MKREVILNPESTLRVTGAINSYSLKTRNREFDGEEMVIADMLADMMHFCDEKKISFSDAFCIAKAGYNGSQKILELELREYAEEVTTELGFARAFMNFLNTRVA